MARRMLSRPPDALRSPRAYRRPRRARALACLASVALASGCGGGLEARMDEVRALQDVGQFSASIDALHEVLTIDPNDPEANFRLGLALVQTGEPSRAIWPLQRAAESSDYQISAGVMLSSTYFQTRNYDEAIHAATRVLEADPERQAAMRIRANANLAARNLNAALEDAQRLVELYPEDYGVRALHATVLADMGRVEEAEREHDLLKKMGEASDDPVFRSRSCLAPATFAMDILKDTEKARGLYEDCARQNPTDPVVLNHLMDFFDGIGASDRATQLIRSAVEAAPENLALRHGLAMRLRNSGDAVGAEKVLKDAVETFGSAAAWNLLANFYRLENRPADALDAIENVIRLSGDAGEPVRFTQADILIDLGQLDRAEEVAERLEQPAYSELIRGRILLTRGDSAAALDAFGKGIRAWPNNASARYLAGTAARNIGDIERAISEFREAVRANNAETGAALELARIYLQQGDYEQALAFAKTARSAARRTDETDIDVVAARAASGLGDFDRALQRVDALRQRGNPTIATREQALIEHARGGPERSLAVIAGAGLDTADPANEELLQERVRSLIELKRMKEALARVEEAMSRGPARASLHELRGLVLYRAGRADEARAAFEHALALDARSAPALAGLAGLAEAEGDRAGAIALFDRAYAAQPLGGGYAYSAAQLVLMAGNRDDAEARLRAIVRRHPDLVGARNDLAWLLSERGEDLDLALSLAEEAEQRDASPEILDTLGWVHFKRGELEQAVSLLERAAAQRPDASSTRYRLGVALAASGAPERAAAAFEQALAGGPFPEADAARRELARLGPR